MEAVFPTKDGGAKKVFRAFLCKTEGLSLLEPLDWALLPGVRSLQLTSGTLVVYQAACGFLRGKKYQGLERALSWKCSSTERLQISGRFLFRW